MAYRRPFDVFLSHSSVDQTWVSKLKEALDACGIKVWLDKDEIRPGDVFVEALESGLEKSKAIALVISPQAVASGWVREEYFRAVNLTQDKRRPLRLIPIILRDAELPGFLGSRHWVDFRNETEFDQSIERLVWGITGRKPVEPANQTKSKPQDSAAKLLGADLDSTTVQNSPNSRYTPTFQSLPAGHVTFLFTDIEGSTKLWEQNPESMTKVLSWHDEILNDAILAHAGTVFKTLGDGFCAVFASAADALAAVVEIQRTICAKDRNVEGSIRVRMALHSGIAVVRAGDYFGPVLNRVSRLLNAGHGGQVLLSQATADLAEGGMPGNATLLDLGSHRLRDLTRPEQVYQLCHPDLPTSFPPLRSLTAFTHNLPLQLTSFVGREQHMEEVKRIMASSRLTTLIGSGGVGKTRLALQVAADQIEVFEDGVWQVELAGLAESNLVAQTVAQTLGIREEANRPIIATLAEFLQSKHLLIVLDNCEHLIDASSHLVATLLESCPRVRFLATSRQALRILGETAWRVPSLSFPSETQLSATQLAPEEELTRYEATRLFIDRAHNVSPEFKVSAQSATGISRICRRLDGIPLAIELAAARVPVLSVAQIADWLDNRFKLLTSGNRTGVPRHQTLKAVIDWSYDLLTEAERDMLLSLSVFAGGWTWEAAASVCAQESSEAITAFDLLSQLVEKSLVTVEERMEKPRYRLLESVRQYCGERARGSLQFQTIQKRHFDYYLSVAESAETNLWRSGQTKALESLELEHDNFRAALDWGHTSAGSGEQELRLAGALGGFWHVRGFLTEGLDHLMAGLRRCGADPTESRHESSMGPDPSAAARGKALIWAATLTWFQGDMTMTYRRAEAALALARTANDQSLIARSLITLGFTSYIRCDLTTSEGELREGLAAARRSADMSLVASGLAHLGFLALFRGDADPIEDLCNESLSVSGEIGDLWTDGVARLVLGLYHQYFRNEADQATKFCQQAVTNYRELKDAWMLALSINILGLVAQNQGDAAQAAKYHREGLTMCCKLGDNQGIALSLEGLAASAASQGHVMEALRMLGAAEALRESLSAPIPPFLRPNYAAGCAMLKAALGDETFTSLWTDGRRASIGQIVTLALQLSLPAQ